jgi:hypothetical protein
MQVIRCKLINWRGKNQICLGIKSRNPQVILIVFQTFKEVESKLAP